MDDLHVNSKLSPMVTDDQDSDATATSIEGFGEAGPELGLIDNGERLLDIAGFGHRNHY
jgi:hypothetical protein